MIWAAASATTSSPLPKSTMGHRSRCPMPSIRLVCYRIEKYFAPFMARDVERGLMRFKRYPPRFIDSFHRTAGDFLFSSRRLRSGRLQ